MTKPKQCLAFLKKEPTLCAAALLAMVSMAAAPPSAAYLSYIDFRVLCLLFCLMAVVAGFRDCGLFELLAQRLLAGRRPFRAVCVLLVLLPFFCSMLVTNDVALLAFVPFAVFVLELAGRQDAMIRVIVLQTVAANLGSMATPVGNPQNLYLYAHYQLSPGEFFSLLLPLTLVSLLGLLAASAWGGGGTLEIAFPRRAEIRDGRRLAVYGGLFALCLLSVFRVLPYQALTVIVAAAFLVLSPGLLRKVDYGLLATFVCFFIFSGNLGQLPAVRGLLEDLTARSPLLSSAAVSQIISNVPAAVLLAPLTEDWRGLLLGVDVGGLGTPVASLASLISLKLYLAREDRRVSAVFHRRQRRGSADSAASGGPAPAVASRRTPRRGKQGAFPPGKRPVLMFPCLPAGRGCTS